MAHLELAFASKDTSLSVRTFSIREGISKPFDVSVIARSEVHDLDLDAFLGKGGALAVGSDLPSAALKGARVWHGVVSHMEQLAVEPDGLSTYFLRIVPDLHRTTLRKNARVFQNKTIPEIVRALLAEWQIDPELRLGADYPRFEYRVQYDETDFAFLNRLLEEAGIAYFFRHGEVGHGESPSSKEKSRLVLCDAPGHAEPRAGGPLPFVDEPTHAGRREHVRHVRLRHQMKPGRVTVRDFDFRTRPDYQLLAEAREAAADEERYEHFHYAPGAFVVLGDKGGETPVADDRGAARVDERRAAALAERMLHAHRGDRRRVTFASNCVDLHPGTVMSVADHPRADLADPLLVTDMTLEGSHAGEWSVQCEAAFGKSPWRPQPKTPRPRVHGVQSAVVVGPPGEEIHTDEFGRVRVQFHWDRQGKFDEQSSCWIRVSHGWAGSSYGMLSIPRVGQEVLVEFYEGDPDRPVITGRVYNNTTRVPYKLPEDKTKSGWKTSSSPGADGFSELMFDDRKGKELVFLQAQKDLSTIVKDSESHVVGNDRATNVGANDALTIGKNLRVDVAADHALTVGGDAGVEVLGSRDTTVAVSETVRVGASYALSLGADTGVVMQDGRLTITNGKASIVISGGDIFFDASGDVTISAGGKLTLSGQEVSADASPLVLLNCGAPLAPSVVKLAAETLAHAVKDVEKEANHLAKAIEMAGHGKWVFPGELVDAVEDAPEFLELDGGIFGDIKKGVKELEHEAALLKKKLHPYLHYLKLAEHLIHHHSLKDIEHEVLHLLGLDQLDGLLGGMNKHKLYGGGGGHGPHPHHPHPGGGNGNHPHQPHPGGGGGNGNHPHQPHAGGGGNGNHPHQPHAGGGGNGNHPHQPHPGGGGGGGNGNHPHQPHPGGGGGNGNHPHQPHAGGGGGNGNHPHQPHAGGGGQAAQHVGTSSPHAHGAGGDHAVLPGHQQHAHPGHHGGSGAHHHAAGPNAHGGANGHGAAAHDPAPHGGADPEQAHAMQKTLGPKLGSHVAADTHKVATIHESIQHAGIGHDLAHPAMLGQSWNRPIPPGSAAAPHHLGHVVNGVGHVQVFHVAQQVPPAHPMSALPAGGGAAAAASGAGAVGSAQAEPKQYLALKTRETPYHVDADALHQQRQRYLASGMSDHEATAKALKQHGVALYEGDGAGHFRKVPA